MCFNKRILRTHADDCGIKKTTQTENKYKVFISRIVNEPSAGCIEINSFLVCARSLNSFFSIDFPLSLNGLWSARFSLTLRMKPFFVVRNTISLQIFAFIVTFYVVISVVVTDSILYAYTLNLYTHSSVGSMNHWLYLPIGSNVFKDIILWY